MGAPEKINENDVLWLLRHESEFRIGFFETAVDIKGTYKEVEKILKDGTAVTEWIRTGIIMDSGSVITEAQSPDEAIQRLKELGMPTDGIDLIQYEVWHEDYRFNTDTEDRSFYSDFHNARRKAEFTEIDMNGLLNRYLPFADSIRLTVFAFDPKGLPKSDYRKRPGKVKRCTERFEKLKNIRDAPIEALELLGIPQLNDSFIGGIFQVMNGNTDIYECHLFFRLDDTVASWMRMFDTDYEMGDFEDLCFCKKKKVLYDSVSHEHMRFDYIDPALKH